ncbi:TDP-N-acetylfucosamine:lipid II N-acetylfucosaminyltransferase [Bordetella genomosp. 13]|uniref:TDP-N-acetylfucosamine:lipid II N-acetylfucosaminyltransferase n=1 Tax=Bordetella genomosp. 13 TaxID=463040 RepID=UPI0011A99E92|nr:TDP-N-acetylfucosamine:lipid II N-acetylfucosaminyltransferase [Bordetella genomosp. 13]
MAKPPLPRSQAKSAAAALPTLQQLEARTLRSPEDAEAWKALGKHLLDAGELEAARSAVRKAGSLAEDDADACLLLAQIELKADRSNDARRLFQHAMSMRPGFIEAQFGLASVEASQENNELALAHLDDVLAQQPKQTAALSLRSRVLTKLTRFEEAIAACETLIRLDPRNASVYLIDLGNIQRDLSQFEEAERCYRRSAMLSPAHRPAALSNLLTLLHYMPNKSADDILEVCKEWGALFTRKEPIQRPRPGDRSPQRIIRVGMFSDGFRQHPVGAMTLTALEELRKYGIEIYAYTSSPIVDSLTQRMITLAQKWLPISRLNDMEFANQLLEDGIDILIDLSGHNAGTRMPTIALEPAPIIIKWVGGLINTTGAKAFDYLITDSVESPPGSDAMYTEKLIRMPDDYICYLPPARIPDVGPLPALKNGYVTFGCFNNPTKLNDVLLAQWAALMQAVPDSRLYLRSGSLGVPARQKYILDLMASHGIAAERIRLEGRCGHYQLFECYNEVDIALDPWPYSGGLTTCEALLMGVPVITLPGPTFAGRHSATHLANVGMPELVTEDWAQYVARAQELASNLDTLSVIRSHLRQILLDSPVCNAPKFGRHLADALRAVWQRYCEDKPQAALAFTADGQPWFEDDDAPTSVQHPEVRDDSFSFSFKGKIVTLDHGGALTLNQRFQSLRQLQTLSTIAIDPAGNIRTAEQLKASRHLDHYHSNVALGDGTPATLYACLDPAYTGTLEPLPAERQLPKFRQPTSVLAKLPISTQRLDGIEGLQRIEWLVLDGANDNRKVLEGAQRLLTTVLLVQIRTLFVDLYHDQTDLGELGRLLAGSGLRLLRLDDARYEHYFPEAEMAERSDSTGAELVTADAIFIPDDARLKTLDDNQRLKLAFLLHSAYGLQDLAFSILALNDEDVSQRYLKAGGWLNQPQPTQAPAPQRQAVAAPAAPASAQGHAGIASAAPYVASGRAIAPASTSKYIHVVDIGANPIDGDPPYKKLLKEGKVHLVGFEPQREALQQLNRQKGKHESYLPYAVGSGSEVTLYLCRAPGMTSTLRPNFKVLDHFQGYPVWGEILREERMPTVRLDDVQEIESIDWLKIDIQGGELTVFKHGEAKLANTLVIQTEVNFIQLYENQPLFAEIDQWMRARGFMLHTLLEERRRLYAPYVHKGQIHQGLNQLTTADAVYVRDINSLHTLTALQREKMATILQEAYGSLDLAQKIRKIKGEPSPAGQEVAPILSQAGRKRFVHLGYNNVHTQKFVAMLESGALGDEFTHQILIEQNRSVADYDNDLSRCPNASFFDQRKDMDAVLRNLMAPDVAGIFIHGLFFDWQKQLIKQVGPHKKVTWFLWGGDLYLPIRMGAPFHDVAQHIHAIASDVDGDYKLFCDTYGTKPRIRFAYPTDTDFTEVAIPACKSKTIFVGNSGDPGNCHIEILTNLAKKRDIDDYRIVIPVSYNYPDQYAQQLESYIKTSGLAPQIELLTTYMAPQDYHARVADAELFVTAHHRSQAYGNLIAAMYFGTKSVLRKEIDVNNARLTNPNWGFLTENMGIEPIDYAAFCQARSLADVPGLTAEGLKQQQQKILSYYDPETLGAMLRAQFRLAAEF